MQPENEIEIVDDHGAQLQAWLAEHNVSRPELAARVGVVRQAVGGWIRGKSFPQGEPKERLFAETNLGCYGPTAIAPPKRLPAKGLKRPGRTRFFKSAAGQKQRAEFSRKYSGRPQPKNLGRTGPSRRDGSEAPIVSDWEIAQRLGCGESVIGMRKTTQSARAKSLGLDYGTVFFCEAGNPFDNAALRGLRSNAGFTAERFGSITGVPADTEKLEGIRIPEHAKKIIGWRDRTLTRLLSQTTPAYQHHRVLKTLVPQLGDSDVLFREALGRLKDDGTVITTLSRLGEAVSLRARGAAIKTEHGGFWGEALRYLIELAANPQSRKYLEAHLASFGQRPDVADFVREVLAARYGASFWIVRRALPRTTAIIPSAEMCGVILSYGSLGPAFAVTETKKSRERGRPISKAKVFEEARRLFKTGQYSWPKIAHKLTPDAWKASPRKAGEAIRRGVERL
jgi:hypothetical protein